MKGCNLRAEEEVEQLLGMTVLTLDLGIKKGETEVTTHLLITPNGRKIHEGSTRVGVKEIFEVPQSQLKEGTFLLRQGVAPRTMAGNQVPREEEKESSPI